MVNVVTYKDPKDLPYCPPTTCMNFVEPIRSPKKIGQIKYLLRDQGRESDLLLFAVGINTALRISALLPHQSGIQSRKGEKVETRLGCLSPAS